MTIVYDQDGREFALLETRLKKLSGTRWASRASIAKVLSGSQRFVAAGSAHPNAKRRWPSCATKGHLRIGCRKFKGNNFAAIARWAQ